MRRRPFMPYAELVTGEVYKWRLEYRRKYPDHAMFRVVVSRGGSTYYVTRPADRSRLFLWTGARGFPVSVAQAKRIFPICSAAIYRLEAASRSLSTAHEQESPSNA